MSAATPVVADTHALVCYLDTDVASAAAVAPRRPGDPVDGVLEGDHIEGGPPLGEHGDDLTELLPVAQLRDQLMAMLLESASLSVRRGVVVSAITIRNVDPELERQLRIRACGSQNPGRVVQAAFLCSLMRPSQRGAAVGLVVISASSGSVLVAEGDRACGFVEPVAREGRSH